VAAVRFVHPSLARASMSQAHSHIAAPAGATSPVCCMALILFYFAGPLAIAVELLKPVLSIPIMVLFLFWLRQAWILLSPDWPAAGNMRKQVRFGWPRRATIAPAIAVFVLAGGWIYFSGIGSFTYCRFDYVKHNVIFTSLLASHLPIPAGSASGDMVHYYFAYYIIPVRIFEILQPVFRHLRLEHLTYAIYCLALVGSLRLLALSLRVPAMGLLLLLVFTGGLDIAGRLLLGPELRQMDGSPFAGIPFFVDLDWWGVPYAPQSPTLNLFWAPQHFFGAIIGTALVCYVFALPRPRSVQLLHAACLVAASTLWSPYVAVGLAVLVLGATSKTLLSGTFTSTSSASPATVLRPGFLGSAIFLIVLAAFVVVFFAAANPASPPSLIFAHADFGRWLLSFILRLAPAIAALTALWIRRIRHSPGRSFGSEQKDGELARSLAFILAVDAGLLCLTHGIYDDWAMRTTLPISIMISAVLCRFVLARVGDAAKIAVSSLLIFSSASSVNEIAQSAFLPRNCAPYGSYSWNDLGEFAGQYRGRGDSLLYRWLARNPEL
jgi:hypothetical protein